MSETTAETTETTEAAPAKETGATLMDAPPATETPAEPKAAETKPEATEWFWSDGVKGDGEPPEWFKADKYKSVEEQAKAYPELAKKLGSFTGAPEKYELSLPEGVEGEFDPEHPILSRFMERAKESGMSQELFTAVLHDFIEYEIGASEQNVAEQKAQLGPKADARIATVRDHLAKNLSEEHFKAIQQTLTSAAAFEAVEAIVRAGGPARVPDEAQTDQTTAQEQLRELRNAKDEKGNRLYDIDPAHRAKVKAMYEKVYGTGPATQSIG